MTCTSRSRNSRARRSATTRRSRRVWIALDALYGRGVAAIHLGDYPAAVRDLEQVTSREPKHAFHRAIALLAHAYANTGQPDRAEELFKRATEVSTLSETYLNYAALLAAQNRPAEAREWAERVSRRNPPCRATCSAVSARGSARRTPLLKRLPKNS